MNLLLLRQKSSLPTSGKRINGGIHGWQTTMKYIQTYATRYREITSNLEAVHQINNENPETCIKHYLLIPSRNNLINYKSLCYFNKSSISKDNYTWLSISTGSTSLICSAHSSLPVANSVVSAFCYCLCFQIWKTN